MLMLMYMTVLIYGMNVMRSVLEEKGTRNSGSAAFHGDRARSLWRVKFSASAMWG